MEKPMDWLFNEENMATAVVVASFCVFTIMLIFVAR
jgi:hypothetical protein